MKRNVCFFCFPWPKANPLDHSDMHFDCKITFLILQVILGLQPNLFTHLSGFVFIRLEGNTGIGI